jgi:hypothetical protein
MEKRNLEHEIIKNGTENKKQKILYPRGAVLRRLLDLSAYGVPPSFIKLYHEGIVVDESTQEIVHVPGFTPSNTLDILKSVDVVTEKVSLEKFADGQSVERKEISVEKPLDDIANVAESLIGKIWEYNLLLSTNLCALGKPISYQSKEILIKYGSHLFSKYDVEKQTAK